MPALRALRQPPQSGWELAAFYSSMSVAEPPRPFFPKMALAAEVGTGFILGFFLAPVEYTLAQTAAQVVIDSITKYQYRPAVIRIDSLNLCETLKPMAEALGVKLIRVGSLPMANEARQALDSFNRQL